MASSESLTSALEQVLAAVDGDAGELPEVVTFVVGGRKYQILEQTIRLRGQTMLSDLLDDPSRSDKAAPIYVEGDSERFRYVLDWYRFGSLKLPITVSLEEMKRDCAFYGLPEDINIAQEGMGRAMRSLVATKQTIREESLKHRMRAAAHAAFRILTHDEALGRCGMVSKEYHHTFLPAVTDIGACLVWHALFCDQGLPEFDIFKDTLQSLAQANEFTVSYPVMELGQVTISLTVGIAEAAIAR